jgi:hypothetical protein
VERGFRNQRAIQLVVHRVVGTSRSDDLNRWDSIARARNEGKLRGTAPWLMFLDDDVVLEPRCISTLIDELDRRPSFAALAADYLGERCEGQIAPHVSMGATVFRRQALEKIHFRWEETRCECQCCCDDLRRLHWGIDYCRSSLARHLRQVKSCGNSSVAVATRGAPKHCFGIVNDNLARIPRVCLVVCYFGAPPGWIKNYLVSCAYNPSVDFLIFTDQKDFPSVSPNVRVRRLSQSSFNTLASERIGVKVRLSHPRKLCDFKPTYGHLFEEFLDGWDYWGYTDLDVIYGDLRRFLSAAGLQKFDVFTARTEYLVGHFTLFRNKHNMRMLYRQSANFRAALQSPQVVCFDECGNQWPQRLQGKLYSGGASCDSMTHIVRRLVADKKISACFLPAVVEWPELNASAWRLRWHAGRLWFVDQSREAMYFHFHAFKERRGYREPCSVDGDAAFELSPMGIERASERI